ncbi:MAG: hypothetical protein KDA20_04455 [Phycisphaerales bacterium]|nr:hypothetical protein [Phycisphaerales bacterium]
MNMSVMGKVAAGALVLLVVGVIGYSVWKGPAVAPSPNLPGGANTPIDLGSPPPVDLGSGPVGQVTGSVYLSTDPDTGEVKARMEWDALDPAGEGRFEVTKPRAHLYNGDQIVEVTADHGKILWPDRQANGRPESGTLEGDVTIRVIERFDDGGDDLVHATLKTPTLKFQSLMGQAEATGEVVLEAPGVRFEGRGLTIRFSELSQRLQYLQVAQHKQTTINAMAMRRAEESARARRGGSGADPSANARASTDAPGVSDYYAAKFLTDVRIERGGASITADAADIWVHLVDRQLQDGAITSIDFGQPTAPTTRSGATTRAAAAADDEQAQVIRLTSTGPIEVLPLEDAPEALAHDEVALKLSAPDTGRVVARDDTWDVVARVGSLTWGFTSQSISARGVGGELGVEFEFKDRAALLTGSLDADLRAGTAAFPGAGRLRAASESDIAQRLPKEQWPELQWSGSAHVQFDPIAGEQRDSLTIALRQFVAFDRVIARSPEGEVRGETIRASFDPGELARLTHVSAEGSASVVVRGEVEERDIARANADRLDVLFDTAPESAGRIVPLIASATGHARASARGDEIEAGLISLTLAEDEARQLQVTGAVAEDNARIATRRGLLVSGSRIDADALAGVVGVEGAPAVVGAFIGRDDLAANSDRFEHGLTILGDQIRVDESKANLVVFGGGNLSYAQRGHDRTGHDKMSIDFSRGLLLDDLAGRAELLGAVQGRAEAGGTELYDLVADRIVLETAPGMLDEQTRRQLEKAGAPVVRVAHLEATEDEPAKAELRRFAAASGDTPGVLESALALRGPVISTDFVTRVVDVPEAGTLLVEDRRGTEDGGPSPDPFAEQGAAPGGGSLRGTSVFNWAGAFQLNAASGVATMERSVRLRHLAPGAERAAELECERLTANFTPLEAQSDPSAATLQSALAEGGVFARHGANELVADQVRFDGGTSELLATARPGNRVTLFDAETARNIAAEGIIIDLITGAWRATQVSGSGSQ